MEIKQSIIILTLAFYCCLLVAEVDAGTGPVNFHEVTKDHMSFIDKTMLIKEFLNDDPHDPLLKVTTAPTRFGKSTLIDMLKRFLTIPEGIQNRSSSLNATENDQFFCRTYLNICKDKGFVIRHMAQYPVIHIDYHILGNIFNFYSLLVHLRNVIVATFKQHHYLEYNTTLFKTAKDERLFSACLNKTRAKELQPRDIEIAFLWLSQLLFKHYNRKVIVLVDEYDAFLSEQLFGKVNYTSKVTNFVNNMHKLFFDHNGYIEKALLTGVLRVRGIGVSPISGIHDYQWLGDHRFSQYYGFTKVDIAKLLKRNVKGKRQRDKFEEVLNRYYKGYKVLRKRTTIYSPWSVIQFIRLRMKTGSYWFNKSRFKGLEQFMVGNEVCMNAFKKLLVDEGFVSGDISRPLDQNDIVNIKTMNITEQAEFERLVVVLYDLGFLIPMRQRNSDTKFLTAFTIPNTEIHMEFCRLLVRIYIIKYNYTDENIKTLLTAVNRLRFMKHVKFYVSFYAALYYLINESKHYLSSEEDVQSLLFVLVASEFQHVHKCITPKNINKTKIIDDNSQSYNVLIGNIDNMAIVIEIKCENLKLMPDNFNKTEHLDYLARVALKRILTIYDRYIHVNKKLKFKKTKILLKGKVYIGLAYDTHSRNMSIAFYNPILDKAPTIVNKPFHAKRT